MIWAAFGNLWVNALKACRTVGRAQAHRSLSLSLSRQGALNNAQQHVERSGVNKAGSVERGERGQIDQTNNYMCLCLFLARLHTDVNPLTQ